MKKTLLAIILLLLPLYVSAYPAQGFNRRADVNLDGQVDVGDVNYLLQWILSEGGLSQRCDLNADGRIDVGDINEVLGMILNPLPFHDPQEFLSRTLPVLHIDTEYCRMIASKDVYLNATYWLDPMGCPEVEAIGDEKSPLRLQIKGRGNNTWKWFDKKQYRIKLDKKASLLGMNKSKHWCLMCYPEDYFGFLLNPVGFQVSRMMGMEYTPAVKPVELVVNGEYLGLYFISEKIRVEENKVEITDQNSGETNPEKITGGWLCQMNHPDTNEIIYRDRSDAVWSIVVETPDSMGTEQRAYIRDLLYRMDSVIYECPKNDDALRQLVDVESLVKFYITYEIVDNLEGFSGSMFFYKDIGEESKVKFGPVWDFGNSFHRTNDELNSFFFNNLPDGWKSLWIGELAGFDCFQEMIPPLWRRFYDDREALYDYIERLSAEISAAVDANNRRWPEMWPYPQSFSKKSYMTKLTTKIEWLNEQWSMAEQ